MKVFRLDFDEVKYVRAFQEYEFNYGAYKFDSSEIFLLDIKNKLTSLCSISKISWHESSEADGNASISDYSW